MTHIKGLHRVTSKHEQDPLEEMTCFVWALSDEFLHVTSEEGRSQYTEEGGVGLAHRVVRSFLEEDEELREVLGGELELEGRWRRGGRGQLCKVIGCGEHVEGRTQKVSTSGIDI